MESTKNHDVKILDDVVFIFLTYNQEKYIPFTLPTAFNQTCFPSTLIIMDDASPDNSDQIIRQLIKTAPEKLNIEYWHNTKNIGLVGQLNKLVDKFENKLIVLQAGDDESYPNRLEETYNAWISNNKPSLVLANYDCIDENGRVIKKFDPESKSNQNYTLDRIIRRRTMVYGCCAAFDCDLLNYFGPINLNVINEDRVNAFRAFFRRGIVYVHKPLLRYRSEVGISAFKIDTKQAVHNKIVIEAKRELLDIECHLTDLDKVSQMKVKILLLARKKDVEWLTRINFALSFISVFTSILQGVSINVVLKTVKKLQKVKVELKK